MKPLTGSEMRKALDEAEAEATKLGRPVLVIHNRLWDHIWKGPWRVAERAGPDDIVIMRDVRPAPERQSVATPDPTDAPAPYTPYSADAPLITTRRADLPGYQEPRI